MSQTQDPHAYLSIASLIDHTLLKPDAVELDIVQLCSEAALWKFASVCVNPFWVPLCRAELGHRVTICSVAGFPLGASQTSVKAAEVALAVEQGAREIDLVQNVGAVRSGLLNAVKKELADAVKVCRANGARLKVILETCLLSEPQIVECCRIAVDAGAAFVKTSTGFSSGGATAAHVELMRATVGDRVGVKASGGVRTLASVREMVAAGANRIGTSSGVSIMREATTHETAQ